MFFVQIQVILSFFLNDVFTYLFASFTQSELMKVYLVKLNYKWSINFGLSLF